MITKVTWDGGKVPTGEDAGVLSSSAAPTRARRTRSASGRRTRTARSSTGPGPRAPTRRRRRSRRRARSAAAAAARRSRSSRSSSARSASCSAASRSLAGGEALARVRRRCASSSPRSSAALALPAAALRRTRRCSARSRRRAGRVNTPPKQVALTYSEAVEPRFAIVSVTDAAARQQTAGPPRRSPANPDTLVVPLKQLARGLVPRLLARDLGRRPSGARRVHVRGRAEPGPGAAVRDPVDLRDGGDAAAAHRALARLPLGDGGDRASALRLAIARRARWPP